MFDDDGGDLGPDELRLVVYIDRSLDFKTHVRVCRGTTIGEVKRRLADADPTGKADPSSFALKLPFSFGAPLGDAEPVPEALGELELCQPAEEEQWPAEQDSWPAEQSEEPDIALGQHAEASSCRSPARLAANAVDGDPLTRWTSAPGDSQWLAVDFGKSRVLTRVEVRWEAATDYEVQGSRDASVWTTVASEAGEEGWVTTALPTGSTWRWVRVRSLRWTMALSIWELRAFADAGAEAAAEAAAEQVVPAPKPAADAAAEAAALAVLGIHEVDGLPVDVVAKEESKPSVWRPPPLRGSFCLGELLWQGAAVLRKAPKCEFFPRQSYGALTLPPARKGFGPSLLLFGGSAQTRCQNDVWRLSLPRLGAQRAYDASGAPTRPRWTCVSAHDDGQLDAQGRRVMRKWRGRINFGYAAGESDSGGLLLFVAGGGDGTGLSMGDVWASQDGGARWLCMNREAPWCKRQSPALCCVPGRPDYLLLAGGMGPAALVCQDTWTSDDAGGSWCELDHPIWGQICGRYRAALLPLEAREPGTARLLLLGGCFIDGGEGGYGGFERLMHDGWECTLELDPVERAKAATWRCWGTATEARGRDWAKVGVEYATCALEPHGGTLVARLPDRDFLSVAAARPPRADAEAIEWHQAEAAEPCDLLTSSLRDGAPDMAAMKLVYVRLASAGRGSVPRLVIASPSEVRISDEGEWRRQVRWVLLLGLRLERRFGLPAMLFHGRVLPSLLPAVLVPKRKRTVAAAGVVGTGPEGQALGHS